MGMVSKKLKVFFQKLFGGGKFLCDSCKYNYRDACTRPERPNARTCEEYRKK